VGGETSLDNDVVVTGEYHCGDMVMYAPQYGALMVALEHRFYGGSQPTKDFATSSLRYLSSQQALADLASFHDFIQTEYKLTVQNRWVAFGGSYPGMLAGWFRLKYPHLVWAAVASSAPVEAIENYQGYNNVVGQSMAATSVGGSTACQSAIQTAFKDLGTNLKTSSGQAALEKQFNVCGSGDLQITNNQAEFLESLSELFPVQGNDPACTTLACNISSCCGVMLNSALGAPLDRLASLANIVHGGTCISANYELLVKALQDTSLAGGEYRAWLYQTCTEFGFYQTCDPDSQCIFTTDPWLNTVGWQESLCQAAFGIGSALIKPRVEWSNVYYGGWSPAGSRILFPNGEIDPWHAASVLQSISADEPALWVVGASHHAWTHVPLPTDQATVVQARSDILAQVDAWLKLPGP
jgi:serine protease 16